MCGLLILKTQLLLKTIIVVGSKSIDFELALRKTI